MKGTHGYDPLGVSWPLDIMQELQLGPLSRMDDSPLSLRSLEKVPATHLALSPDLAVPLEPLDCGVHQVSNVRVSDVAPEEVARVRAEGAGAAGDQAGVVRMPLRDRYSPFSCLM